MNPEIKHVKPEYEVTIGSAFFNIIKKRTNNEIIYEPTVIETPVIKTLGLSRTVSELPIYASGILFDYLSRTAGAQIALSAVVLPRELLDKIAGALIKAGFTFDSTNDITKEFAFGYWGENSDGSFVYCWHPVCKLIPTEETHKTRTEDIEAPERSYTIKVMPYNNLWRVRYNTTDDEAAGYLPIGKEVFFLNPIYKESQIPQRLPAPEPQAAATPLAAATEVKTAEKPSTKADK